MHPLLDELNQSILPFEEIRYLSIEEVLYRVKRNQAEFAEQSKECTNARMAAFEKLPSFIGQLSVEEICEGYRESCRSLKGMIGGYMYGNFDPGFAETIIQAIRDNDDIAYLFMGSMSKYLDENEFKKLILIGLKNKTGRLADTALAYARNVGMTEALPLVMELTKSPDPRLAGIASRIVQSWTSGEVS